MAERARATAESLGDDELACEALEVIGRCWRLDRCGAARRRSTGARVIAETHGLTLWRTREMSELAWLDTLAAVAARERLRSARERPWRAGPGPSPRTSSSPTASGTCCDSGWTSRASTPAADACAELAERLGMPVLLAIAHASGCWCRR